MTKRQQQSVLRDINRRAKGQPVGIPIKPEFAESLVAAGLVEWAPAAWQYPQPVFAVRLTTAGKVAIGV